MIRTYKYRFYPNKKQVEPLEHTLDLCRNLYNAALQQRIYAHRLRRKNHYSKQQNELPALKKQFAEYRSVHSLVLQDTLHRVDKAFKAFFKRVKRKREGENIKAGFPRFKSRQRFNSFTYTQSGFKLLKNGHVWLSKIGELRVFRHREPIGEIKTVAVKRDKVGDWFITIATETLDVQPRKISTALGVDLGLKNFVTLTSGESIDAPKLFRKTERKVRRAQRILSRRVKGSRNREKARIRLAKLYRKVDRHRDDFIHKLSLWLVRKADLLVFEDLKVANMIRNHTVAKSIGDASWSKLVQYSSYKAESAGKRVELVDPRGTTQICSGCGTVVRKSLSERVHRCSTCGLLLGRDLNAAVNILNRSVLRGTQERTPVETTPTPVRASVVKETGSPRA
ncbi:MAG: Transposase, IS605 OrfB family [Candidatus Jorgensenbacteria bacterium GW2011_GWB1_50_10]|uniref:Transposase, IS605 OrfB family n=1 Tax=Candidatus Jorgensenbacteria bacterium GW2011_GWB1_50_10 TaxID=1618665 RepID=A0A0G1W7X5_9BACT|nr:MAG: Transposase, IS605 OrfB family [Candidatus Jorgensenbacteria bacterium GW2011_GWB1_50_10]